MGLGMFLPIRYQPWQEELEAGGGIGAVLTSPCWEDVLVSAPAGSRVWMGQGLLTFLPLS